MFEIMFETMPDACCTELEIPAEAVVHQLESAV
jgi:hypothetical protein